MGMYTGELVIKSAGTVTITATSADGQHTDSRTITSWIDTVIIEKDGVYTKVIFQSTGKEWHGVHNDMLLMRLMPAMKYYGRGSVITSSIIIMKI